MPKRSQKEHYEVSREQTISYSYSSSNGNSKNDDDHYAPERQQTSIRSAVFNSDYRVGASAECVDVTQIQTSNAQSGRTTPTKVNGGGGGNVIYENLTHGGLELKFSKNLLLNAFFRSTERHAAAYENICTGCGYGVFEARGRLCNFCRHVVHGVYDQPPSPNSNIYENICEHCAAIYSSDQCDCQLGGSSNRSLDIDHDTVSSNTSTTADTLEITSNLKAPIKLEKSKSFNKKRLFHGLIGSLRRVRSNLTPSQTPENGAKRLEIVHNVDGYDNVFRTQDTFDLSRICELKRTQTSCSDQHIYGRLKRPEEAVATLSQSHDQLTAQQELLCDELQPVTSCESVAVSKKRGSVKRPRVSKLRLLQARSVIDNNSAPVVVKQSLYLADSVCQWMTSLRREIHVYQSFGIADDDIALCHPKSIPAKQTLFNGATQLTLPTAIFTTKTIVTNCKVIDATQLTSEINENPDAISQAASDVSIDSYRNCDEVVTLRRQNKGDPFGQVAAHTPATELDWLTHRMVHEFKCNLMAKQSREAAAEIATPTPLPAPLPSSKIANQRAKRQAIYLRVDDIPNNNTNGTSEQQLTVAQFGSSDSSVASRRNALLANTSSGAVKRCGVYERDSEFVNDILCAFDTFLQRDAVNTDVDTTTQAEVLNSNRDLVTVAAVADANQSVAAKNSPSSDDDAHSLNSDLAAICDRTHDPELNKQTATSDVSDHIYEHINNNNTNIVQPFGGAATRFESSNNRTFEQIINVVQLIDDLVLSRCLNSVVIYYDRRLSAFLHSVRDRKAYRDHYLHRPIERLVGKYLRFVGYCARRAAVVGARAHSVVDVGIEKNFDLKPVLGGDSEESHSTRTIIGEHGSVAFLSDALASSELKTNCEQIKENLKSVNKSVGETPLSSIVTDVISSKTEVLQTGVAQNSDQVVEHLSPTNSKISAQYEHSEVTTNAEVRLKNTPKAKPRVPQRDPRTCITQKSSSPPLPAKRESKVTTVAMTVPTTAMCTDAKATHSKVTAKTTLNNSNNSDDLDEEEEDDIYQPIWKFKTVGEVHERYHTDSDYYELGADEKSLLSDAPSILISTDVEDHGEWETDDEFMFTTELQCDREEALGDTCSTVRSTHSTSSGSSAGSTITGYGSSTMTMASAVSSSLMHHLFRNIGIFYGVSDPRIRAVIYDYDRVYASVYFAKRQTMPSNDSGVEVPEKPPQLHAVEPPKLQRSPMPPPRTSSATAATRPSKKPTMQLHIAGGESATGRVCLPVRPAPKLPPLLPDSVQAWKFMLLNVNYLEDEEDMIVSESEILRAQESKDDPETRQYQQLHILQRFKSASSGNLLDIPTEEDKKSIAERMRNKLQRGVFKLNVRSPKSEKKSRGIFRRAEATSLYLEDGMKPKYPIFGAPLDQLELNQTTQPLVPRFVVDSVEYIERKDCIQQDGLYRASGNKVSIDELKQKLSESYIYDPKLLATDDIHTLTSLLKQFFRELGAPLIPQETYERLGRNLTDAAAIETLRCAFEEMREPNRSTLKFLIKHLTNVACYSSENRMPASNLAIVWGPCILSANQIEYDIARMNTLAKVLIENYDRIFSENERLVC